MRFLKGVAKRCSNSNEKLAPGRSGRGKRARQALKQWPLDSSLARSVEKSLWQCYGQTSIQLHTEKHACISSILRGPATKGRDRRNIIETTRTWL
jgi:hypothetical protein